MSGNGSKLIQFRMAIGIAATMFITLHFIHASNAFQTNLISNHVPLSFKYFAWYKSKWFNPSLIQVHNLRIRQYNAMQIQNKVSDNFLLLSIV